MKDTVVQTEEVLLLWMVPTFDANTHFVSRSSVTVVNSVSGHVTAMHSIGFLFVAFLDSFLTLARRSWSVNGYRKEVKRLGERGGRVRLLLAAQQGCHCGWLRNFLSPNIAQIFVCICVFVFGNSGKVVTVGGFEVFCQVISHKDDGSRRVQLKRQAPNSQKLRLGSVCFVS